jgi:hypothetical protein
MLATVVEQPLLKPTEGFKWATRGFFWYPSGTVHYEVNCMANSEVGRVSRAGRRYAVLVCLFMLEFALVGRGQSRAVVKKVDHVPRLILQLHDPSPDLRMGAASALGEAKDARAVEPLIVALGDTDDHVRTSAAKALGEIKDPRAVVPLIAAMKSAAAELFSTSYLNDSCQNALRLIGPSAVEPLIVAMSDSRLEVRELAAKVLGKIRDPRAVGPLFTAMKGTDSEDLRLVTSYALAGIGEASEDNLIAALQDQDTEVRWYAAYALADQYETKRHPGAGKTDADDRGEKALIAELGKHNMAAVAGGYLFFYDWGGAGSEVGLIEAINKFGKVQMMRLFLNCGNLGLRKAAEDWANHHDYIITPVR